MNNENNLSKRTPNASKLYDRVLECENDFREMFRSGFKLVQLKSSTEKYFKIRQRLRTSYERIFVEETAFWDLNHRTFDLNLWEECYMKPISWIEEAVKGYESTIDRLNDLRNLLTYFIDEGATFYKLLLRFRVDYNFLVYSAILLEKREKFLPFQRQVELKYSPCRRSFDRLQEAITQDPFKGLGYLVLARWARADGDLLLAIYWALIGANVPDCESKGALQFLKELAKDYAVSPSHKTTDSNEISAQVVQMALHTFLSQLTGKSHLKHLDQLSHSKFVHESDADPKLLKYSCDILWMIVGMEGGLFTHCNGEICPIQSCLLAKLFQINLKFISTQKQVKQSFTAFATNPKYARLFTENNYSLLGKINPFAFESLNSLLEEIIITEPNENIPIGHNNTEEEEEVYFDDRLDTEEEAAAAVHVSYPSAYTDYLMLETFQNISCDSSLGLVDFFIKSNLLVHRENDSVPVVLKFKEDKWKKSLNSMKLLTKQFLRNKLEMAESLQEQDRLSWTVPDYPSLLRHFEKIRIALKERKIRLLITFAILVALDRDKESRIEARSVIRFLADHVEAKDPALQLQSTQNDQVSTSSSHFQCVKQHLHENPDEFFKLIFAFPTAPQNQSLALKFKNITFEQDFKYD